MLRHALIFRGHQGFRHGRCDDRVARRSSAVCAAEGDLARRQIALGQARRVASNVPKESENVRHVKNNSTLIFLFSGLLAFFGPVSCGHAASEQKASYGTRVKYRVAQKIEYPDFIAECVGERRKRVSLLRFQGQQRKGWESGFLDYRPGRFRPGGVRDW